MIRPTVPAAAAAASALLLAACAGGDPEEARTTGAPPDVRALTIGLTYVPDVQFAPFYVAETRGYYAESGVDVTLRHHGQQESLFGALESGEEDLVVAGGDEMLQARSQGVDVVNVATLYQDYPVVLIVPEDSPVAEPAGLRGRSVGVPGPFGETYFGLLVLLAEAGLTEEDVDVQHIGFTQQAALTAGHVDAVMGFVNNDVVAFERAGLPVRTVPVAEDVPLVGIGIGAREDVLAADAAAVEAVVAATVRGVEDVLADPEAALDAAARHVPGLAAQRDAARATLQATAELYTTEGRDVGEVDPAAWEAMAAFMTEHGLLGEEDITVTDTFRTGVVR